MSTAFEVEEEELASLPDRRGNQTDRELTLSSTTLLMLFFGLVLLCGLFFGLGYTLGRRAPQDAGTVVPESTQVNASIADARSKPSAAAQTSASANPAIPVSASPEEQPKLPDAVPAEAPGSQLAADAKPTLATPEPTPAKQSAAAKAPPAAIEAPISTVIMVQVAAVSDPADADVLVGALRKRGYTVTVRHEPTDKFMHVQIGPFSSRVDANAMRQKLQSDGYAAVLK
jgi:cell division septation protein DedD